jgi:5-methylcytosine-specific restriction endonuclease McrA
MRMQLHHAKDHQRASGDNARVKVRALPAVDRRLGSNCTRVHRCGRHCVSTEDPRSDHLVRVAAGESDEDSNLQVFCGPCNRTKGAAIEAGA